MGHYILPSGSVWRILFFPSSVYSWQVVHKTFYWHNSFCGSTFATQDRLRLLILSLSSFPPGFGESFLWTRPCTHGLFKDQIRKSGSKQAIFERTLSVQGDPSECPRWSISFPDSTTSPFATAGPDLIREEKKNCWSSLDSWCEEGECIKSDPGWKLRIMACAWTINRNVQPELRHTVTSKIWSLLRLEPWFIANFTVEELKQVAFRFYGNQRVGFSSTFIQWNFAVLHSSSKAFKTYCYLLLLLAFSRR